jgi:hypothetical protein
LIIIDAFAFVDSQNCITFGKKKFLLKENYIIILYGFSLKKKRHVSEETEHHDTITLYLCIHLKKNHPHHEPLQRAYLQLKKKSL